MSEIASGGRPVEAYGPGGFQLLGRWHEGSLLVSAAGLVPFAPPPGPALIERVIDEGGLDLIVFGSGSGFEPLAPALCARLEAAGIGVETMATPAACRTYNLLLAEGRRVAALLIAL